MNGDDKVKTGGGRLVMAVLVVVCCALPLLLLSGISLAVLVPSWRVIGIVLAVLGGLGVIWYRMRR